MCALAEERTIGHFMQLFREGKLGQFTLDNVGQNNPSSRIVAVSERLEGATILEEELEEGEEEEDRRTRLTGADARRARKELRRQKRKEKR
tara:strand:- start:230 stop:502 length:273 start_codon:yes stop_codon:yes gene_type:complete